MSSFKEEELLYGRQTSGGLLLSVPHEQAKEPMNLLKKNNIPASLRRNNRRSGWHYGDPTIWAFIC
jgi:selenophosphate synthase